MYFAIEKRTEHSSITVVNNKQCLEAMLDASFLSMSLAFIVQLVELYRKGRQCKWKF